MNTQLAEQLVGVIQIGREGIEHLQKCIDNGEMNQPDLELLVNYYDLVQSIINIVPKIEERNRLTEIGRNLEYYLDKLLKQATTGEVESFLFDFTFHFSSLFKILEFEIAYLIENHVEKEKLPHLFPEEKTTSLQEILTQGKDKKYKVSIVLLAYNNLDYTRNCVESIIRNTNDINYELILVDNGSTDGTKEYFEKVQGAKVLHLPYNIHLVKGFNLGLMAAEGEYSAAVCNDFIFPPNWLTNLLICIESNPLIGFVSPGATNISNLQQIDIPFHSIEDFEKRAEEYNLSDPSKWEERVVLLPNVLCSPTALLKHIGYYDTRYYRGEFLDDDISFKIRRAGFKLVYCGDTVTHHYGSLTTASDHLTNSIEEGRETFFDKYQLDAWADARMNLDYKKIVYEELSQVKTIVGLDVKCGATVLQIKNQLASIQSKVPSLVTGTTDKKYLKDLNTISDTALYISHISDLEKNLIGKNDLIYIEKPLDEIEESFITLLEKFSDLLAEGGTLIFTINNSVSIESIYQMINQADSLHNRKIYFNNRMKEALTNLGFSVIQETKLSSDRSMEDNELINSLAKLIVKGRLSDIPYVETLLSLRYTLFQVKKVKTT